MIDRASQQNAPADAGPLVVGLGEALFDCFPHRVELGGAPVNVAVHATALLAESGGRGVPATRVGADELGDRFFAELAERRLSGEVVQVDPRRATGRVLVELDDDGQAIYDFEPDAAWDNLVWSAEWSRLAGACDAVAFGTLGQRSATSRETIQRFLSTATSAIRLFDVNLRGDFYSPSIVAASLEAANAVKLNAEEIVGVSRMLDPRAESNPDVEEQARRLIATFDLDWLALTRGALGTVLFHGGERYAHDDRGGGGRPLDSGRYADADSVGAGDACCAGLLTGMLLGWEPRRTLALANRAGAFVASRPGATPRLPRSLVASAQSDGPGSGAPP